MIAFTDRVAHEWFAPAGLNRGGLSSVRMAKKKLTHTERDQLYDDFIEIDELNEIGEHWIAFSEECVKSLISFFALTETLSDRFEKEYKVLDPAEPGEMEKKIETAAKAALEKRKKIIKFIKN